MFIITNVGFFPPLLIVESGSPTTFDLTETKNTWARDDPAMLILISGCLLGTSLMHVSNLTAVLIKLLLSRRDIVVHPVCTLWCHDDPPDNIFHGRGGILWSWSSD